MYKDEFLKELRTALQGEVSQGVINENISYYGNYIDSELRNGRTIEEIMDELGSARLIARTIIDTQEMSGINNGAYSDDISQQPSDNKRSKTSWFDTIYRVLVFAAVLIIIGLVIRALLPVIFIAIVIGIIASILRR